MENKKSIIPIKNLFYMLCYAWNVLDIKDDINVDRDDFVDAYDLLARIFTFGIEKLIKNGFHRSYVSVCEDLSTIRGKINLTQTINNNSMLDKKIYCDYDEYSTNDCFNQILKYTINKLVKNENINQSTKNKLKKYRIFFNEIIELEPTKINRRKIIFNKNNVIYKMLINVSLMLYDNTMVNEDAGQETFKDFFREEQMQKVFELFLLNFYKVNLDSHIYHVHAPKIDWHMEKDAETIWNGVFDVETTLTDRRTDIVVENRELNSQTIIDAKYYQNTFIKAYMNADEERIRASHINQVRGYILDSEFNGNKIGALIYPMTTHDLQKGKIFPIKDANIIVKTVNLNVGWKEIEGDLSNFIKKIECKK